MRLKLSRRSKKLCRTRSAGLIDSLNSVSIPFGKPSGNTWFNPFSLNFMYEQQSFRVSRESEGVEVNKGRPLGPTSREGSFSSSTRRPARAASKSSAPAESKSSPVEEATEEEEPPVLDLVLDLGLPFLDFPWEAFAFLEE